MDHLISGILIGLSIAAPVGPVGILCIRRTLSGGWLPGLLSGLGAATADAIYGSIAAFGLTAISSALVSQRYWLGLLGGIFLCYLGIRSMKADRPAIETTGNSKNAIGLFGDYASVFLITLSNPMTILSFIGVFLGLGLVAANSFRSSVTMVSGVFIGSSLWWFILALSVGTFRKRIGPKLMTAINYISGLTIIIFGIYSVIHSIL